MNDLLDQTFGLLRVTQLSSKTSSTGQLYYWCLCECGKEKEIRRDNLISGQVKSCGCTRKTKTGKSNITFSINAYVDAVNRKKAQIDEEQKRKLEIRRQIEFKKEMAAIEKEFTYDF